MFNKSGAKLEALMELAIHPLALSDMYHCYYWLIWSHFTLYYFTLFTVKTTKHNMIFNDIEKIRTEINQKKVHLIVYSDQISQ